MRRGLGLGLALLAGLLAGCTAEDAVRSRALLGGLRSFHGLAAPDIVQMDVALVERPVGDRTINEQLWGLADEQVIELERKAVLEDNGLRVCQVGGQTPAELLDLLTRERSCANPRRIQARAGKSSTLVLGPSRDECHFRLHQNGEDLAVGLENAQCVVQVTPSLTADGRTRLQFTPQVRHGTCQPVFRPTAEGSWMLQDQQPTETYAGLGWEVTLAPNEYVVVGGRFDRPGTLGHECFVRADEERPVQRLLVVRTGRPAPGVTADAGDDEARSGGAVPLALQASGTAVRASAPIDGGAASDRR